MLAMLALGCTGVTRIIGQGRAELSLSCSQYRAGVNGMLTSKVFPPIGVRARKGKAFA